jgi:hypothetical protein
VVELSSVQIEHAEHPHPGPTVSLTINLILNLELDISQFELLVSAPRPNHITGKTCVRMWVCR